MAKIKYPILRDRTWLSKMYLSDNLSSLEIAKKVGCNCHTVLKALEIEGINKRKGCGARKGKSIYTLLNDEQWLYQKYWDEKCDMAQIAKEVGCDATVVLRAMKKYGIKRRSLSEILQKRIVTAETRKKRSDAGKAKIFSPTTRRKISIARTKLTPGQRKINRAMKDALRRELKGTKNGRSWKSFVDYTLTDLMHSLEQDFRDGMTWGNHGSVWHIDHIIPLARFYYDSPKDPEFKKAWSLGNLQPLLVEENLKKHTKFMFF